MTDLIYNLRSLAALEHADLSVADEAADEIERLRGAVSNLERREWDLVSEIAALRKEMEDLR